MAVSEDTMCMKLALFVFIAVIAVGCAGSAARAGDGQPTPAGGEHILG